MSRIPAGQPIIVRPSNNIYTVLAGIAALVTLIAAIIVISKGMQLDLKWFAV